MPLSEVGTEAMEWGEAYRQTQMLASDPATRVGAALAGWDYPLSREGLATLDLFDLTHQIAWAQGGKKGPRPKPYPRPWPDRSKKLAKPSVPQHVVIEALRQAGHTAALPAG